MCGAIDIAQDRHDGVGTSIDDIQQLCNNTGEQWLGLHDPLCHASTPDYGPWLCKNLICLRWLKLCGAIAMAQGQVMLLEYPSRNYTKCVATLESNGWAHTTLRHASTPDYGPWQCNNLINLGWLKLCGAIAIAMAQGQCNGFGTFI